MVMSIVGFWVSVVVSVRCCSLLLDRFLVLCLVSVFKLILFSNWLMLVVVFSGSFYIMLLVIWVFRIWFFGCCKMIVVLFSFFKFIVFG